MIKKIAIAAALLMLTTTASSVARAYEDGDFQIWNSNAEEIRIGKDTKLAMEQEFRYGEDATELFYQHYDWGFIFAFDKRLEIQPGYRLVYERVKRKWMESDEPYVNITAKLDIWKFKLEDRNRIEYRHFRFVPDQIRYRNRFLLKYPMEFRKMTVAPYTSDEIFVSSNGTGWNQNRFESGLEFGLTKHARASVSYMLQSIKGKNDKWYEANVLWLRGKISF